MEDRIKELQDIAIKESREREALREKRVPAKGRIIIKQVEGEKKTKGGLFLAETDLTPTEKGVILAVGDCNNKFNVGDACYFQRGGCLEIGPGERVCVENEVLYSEPMEQA